MRREGGGLIFCMGIVCITAGFSAHDMCASFWLVLDLLKHIVQFPKKDAFRCIFPGPWF